MRILLISSNTIREPLQVLPIGLAYISKALKNAGHDISFLDLSWTDDIEKEVKGLVVKFKPELVGIGIRNTDDYNEDPPKLLHSMLRDLVEFLKESGIDQEQIIVGGANPVGIFRESLLNYIGVKYACIGEGENTIVQVAEKINNGHDIKDIPNMAYIEDGEYFENKIDFTDLNHSDGPDLEIYDEKYFKYANKNGLIASPTIQTRRGCPYNCIYCTTPKIEGSKVRCLDPKKVVDEMERLQKRFGDRSIEFLDNDFNVPQQHGEAICEEIIKRGLKINWECNIQPAFTTKNFLTLLKAAHCQLVNIGIETGSMRMMINLKRPSCSRELILDIGKWCKELELNTIYLCLLGGPGETYYTLKNTFELLDEINPANAPGQPTVIFTGGVRIYPDTELASIAIQEGKIWKGHPLLFPEYYFSEGMDFKVYKLINEYRKTHPGWLFNGPPFYQWMKKHEGYDSNYKKEKNEAEIPSNEKDYLNKKLPNFKFLNLKDEEVELESLLKENMVLLAGSQGCSEESEKWYPALKKTFKNNNSCRFQSVASVPPLPSFITKEFVREQIDKSMKRDEPVLIDWDAEFIVNTLNLELENKVIIIGITKDRVLRFIYEKVFSEAAFDELYKKISNLLLGEMQSTFCEREKSGSLNVAYDNVEDIKKDIERLYKEITKDAELKAVLDDIDNLSIQYYFTDLNGWVTKSINQGKVTILKGRNGKPDVIQKLSSETFVKLMSGEIDPAKAATSGKIKIEGDFPKLLLLEPLLKPIKRIFIKILHTDEEKGDNKYENETSILNLNDNKSLMPRMIEAGALVSDILMVSNIIEKTKSTWFDTWFYRAQTIKKAAEECEKNNHLISSADNYLLSSIYFRFAEWDALMHENKVETCQQMTACYEKMSKFSTVFIRKHDIPFEDIFIPSYLYLPSEPKQGDKWPCLIKVGGVDGIKEETYYIAQKYLKRNIAFLAIDLPGHGELRRLYNIPLRYDTEVPVAAVIDYIFELDYIDSSKIGILGVSMGGYFALRASAFEKRISVCGSYCGSYDFAKTYELSKQPVTRIMEYAIDCSNKEAARDVYTHFNLNNIVEKIGCPTLIIAAKKDSLVPFEDSQKMIDKINAKSLIKIFDAEHMAFAFNSEINNIIPDWFLDNFKL